MAKSIRVNKKVGRPRTTGPGELIGVRLQPPDLAKVDSWAAQQEDEPSRPEAIRRLIERGLEAPAPRKQSGQP
jgi:hypothetical protein